MNRLGGANQTLVERVPGATPFADTFTTHGPEAFNSNQLQQGFSAGSKIGVTYRAESGYDIEVSYFNVFAQSASKTTGPDSPADWLVMRAPGVFWQTQDFAYQGMTWSDDTTLYSAEMNLRRALSSGIIVLAGVRWLQLNDKLQGTLTPADMTAPDWKKNNPSSDIFHIVAGGPAGDYPPFWTTNATNNLYGVQIGVAGKLLEYERLSLDGLLKIGLFDNNATQHTGVSLQKIVYPAEATTNHLAFLSEAGLQLRYRWSRTLTFKLGYEALWLAGVALAPAQIEETYTASSSTVRALGVDCRSNVLFQGATFGLEYAF